MTFLTPFMLFGAVAASIPVAIHFFFRSRYRTVPWAAMKFLLTAVEQTSRRLKFQELLLLLLRMTVLILLAIAFARPMSSMFAGAGTGDAVDAVFVFDTSFSMGAIDKDGKTRLALAQEEAVHIIDKLPMHPTVQIITCAGKQKVKLGPRSPGNLDQAKQVVSNLAITPLATDLSDAVAEAHAVLDSGQAPNKELYIFSDMQQLGFDKQPGKLRSTFDKLKDNAAVYFVRCGTQSIRNASVIGIAPQSGTPRANERAGFAVTIRNTGDEEIENLDVSLAVDGDVEQSGGSERIKKLAKQQTHAVTLFGKPASSGMRVLTATLHSDQLDADNRFDQVVFVRDQINILIVDGNYNARFPEKSSSYFLAHSLLPVSETGLTSYKYNPRVVPAKLATSALLFNQDVCILVNCALQEKPDIGPIEPAFVNALKSYVRSGRALLIISGDNVDPASYNQILGSQLGLLPMPLKDLIKAKGAAFEANRRSFADAPPSFWQFKDNGYFKSFDALLVWRHFDLDESGVFAKEEKQPQKEGEPEKESATLPRENLPQVFLRLNSNKPLVVAKKVEAGQVVFISTAAQADGKAPKTGEPNWTIFHELPIYVPFFDTMIAYLVHAQTESHNRVAGETLSYVPKDRKNHPYYLLHPDGKRLDRLGLPDKFQGYAVTAPDLPRAGVYYLAAPRDGESSETIMTTAAAKTGVPIAVTYDLEEVKNMTRLTDEQINDALGFTPRHIVAGAGHDSAADRLQREWTPYVLLAVLALVLIEVVLAWWCSRAW